MKASILCALLVLGSTGLAAQAQTAAPAHQAAQPRPRPVVKGATLKEGFTMKDGQVLHTQSGNTTPLRSDVTLPSGAQVAANGTLTLKDGRTVTLREGDRVSPTGRLTTAADLARRDSLTQVTHEKAKAKKGRRH